MMDLVINEERKDNCILLTVEGTINSYTYGDFEEKIYSAIKYNNIALDLSRVTNLSSSGLGVLMSAHDDGEEKGYSIYILNPSDIVKLAIDSTGFSDMFKIIHSTDDIKV